MNFHPEQLQITPEQQLLITWSDGQRRQYQFKELLDHCPCATCREERRKPTPPPDPMSLLSVIKPEEAQPLQLQGMTPVGNYAYSLKFNYGCQHGIYRFELLRELGTEVS